MPTGAVRGRFMDGKSAADREVLVTIEGQDLVVHTVEGVLARFPVTSAHFDSLGEGDVVHVESPEAPGALLTVKDAGLIAALRHAGVSMAGELRGSRALTIGIASFVTFVALLGGLYLAMPWISSEIARRIPMDVERTMAPKMVGFIAGSTCTTPAATEAVQKLQDRLLGGHEGDVDVRIVTYELPNAFALPGGVVLLTRGLIDEAKSSDEIAGVLAHELAHVEHRHAMAHIVRTALLSAVWMATLGDYAGLMVVDPRTAYETATLEYSRVAEAEADESALEMLTARHISALGLVDFLKRNSKGESAELSFLSTHPSSAERMAHLSAQRLPGPAEPALDEESMKALREACASAPPKRTLRDLFGGVP